MIRVFLADDHAIVRTGLRALLTLAEDMTLVGEASDGHQVIRAAESPDWAVDVLVLDIQLPRINGIEVLRRLGQTHPHLRVLMLSMYAEDQYASRLVAKGAAGYVSKDQSETELLDAIREVAAGRIYVSPALDDGRYLAEKAPHERFSARQLQVFTLLVAGRSVTEMAAELDVAVSTVSTHLRQVKDRLGASTLAEVIAYAHRIRML